MKAIQLFPFTHDNREEYMTKECASVLVVLFLFLAYANIVFAQTKSADAIEITISCDTCHATIGDTVCLPVSMEHLITEVFIVKISIDHGVTRSDVESEFNKTASCVKFTIPKNLRSVDLDGTLKEIPIKDGAPCEISVCPFGTPCSGSPYKYYVLHFRNNSKQEPKEVK